MTKWNLLLTAIDNFLSNLNKRDVIFYNIEFNNINGDNIKLAILTENECFNELREQVDSYFMHFFSDFPDDRLSDPVTGIHLPYPSAIIRFGSFNSLYSESATHTYRLKQTISQFMIKVLKADEVDGDIIITLFAYLQIALLKVCLTKFDDTGKRNFLRIKSFNETQPSQAEKVNESFDLIQEITSDIMKQDEFDYELAWLNDWIKCLDFDLIKSIEKEFDKEAAILQYYDNITLMVSKQLGLSESQRKSLSVLIERALSPWISLYKPVL